MRSLIVLSLVVCLWTTRTQSQAQCFQLPTSSGIQVSLKSLRNENGNWITKVDLERGGGRGQLKAMRTEPWSIDVDANTRTCEGSETTLQVSLTLTAPLPVVGADYELFPGIGYYKFHTVPKSWAGARQVCAEEGTHLVIVNSEKENDVMVKLNARHRGAIPGASNSDWIWVGVERKDGKDGQYVTIFGDSLGSTGFTRWHPGQPNKNANDNCILINRVSGGLGDITCEWVVAFICEKEL